MFYFWSVIYGSIKESFQEKSSAKGEFFFRSDFDSLLRDFIDLDKERKLKEAKDIQKIASLFLMIMNPSEDTEVSHLLKWATTFILRSGVGGRV